MSRKKLQNSPGSILKRGNKLVIKLWNKQHFTGLNDTRENRIIVEKMKDEIYAQYLNDKFNLTTDKPSTTIYEAFDEYLNVLKSKGRTVNTIRSYTLSFKSIFPSNLELNEKVILKTIEGFALAKSTFSSSSKLIYLRGIKVFLNYLYEKGMINKLNVNQYFPTTRKIKNVIPYTGDELNNLIEEILHPSIATLQPDVEFALLIQFMRYSGSRIKEALELNWSDIDFKNGVIHFRNKTIKSNIDDLPISASLLTILNKLLEIKETRKTKEEKEKLFRWGSNSTSRLSRRLNRYEEIIGCKISNQAFHRIRNYYSNKLLDSKELTIVQIKDLMRHKDIRTTLNHYQNKKIEILKGALDKIDL